MAMASGAYDYKITQYDFDPDETFSKVITLAKKMSDLRQTRFTISQMMDLESHILQSLADMVYGSNQIENAGSSCWLTHKICQAVFCGQGAPDEISEADEEYSALKRYLEHSQTTVDPSAIMKSRREVVQHAKAAVYMINELVICNQELSEDIILKAHSILTHKIDAAGTPWMEYSGIYRTDEVRAGLHAFPQPALVPYKMKSMILEFKSDIKQAEKTGTIDPISLASKYAQKFVNIHPFIDGNGRMCRLILNSLLLKYGAYVVSIGTEDSDCLAYLTVAANGSALEAMYEDAEDDEKPQTHKELASFVLCRVEDSMGSLVRHIEQRAGWPRDE